MKMALTISEFAGYIAERTLRPIALDCPTSVAEGCGDGAHDNDNAYPRRERRLSRLPVRWDERRSFCPATILGSLERQAASVAERREPVPPSNDRGQHRPVKAEKARQAHTPSIAQLAAECYDFGTSMRVLRILWQASSGQTRRAHPWPERTRVAPSGNTISYLFALVN